MQEEDHAAGRFRAFLIGGRKKFVARPHQQARRDKHGRGQPLPPMGIPDAELRYSDRLAPDEDTPDQLCKRQWAATPIESVESGLQPAAFLAGCRAVGPG